MMICSVIWVLLMKRWQKTMLKSPPPLLRLLRKKSRKNAEKGKIAKIEVNTTREAKAEAAKAEVIAGIAENAEADAAVTENAEVAVVATEADVEAVAVVTILKARLPMRMASLPKPDSVTRAEATTVADGAAKDAEAVAALKAAITAKAVEATTTSKEVNAGVDKDVAANKEKLVLRQHL